MAQFTKMAVLKTFPDPLHTLLLIKDPAVMTERTIAFERSGQGIRASLAGATTLQSFMAEELLQLKADGTRSPNIINRVEFAKDGIHIYAGFQLQFIEQRLKQALDRVWPSEKLAIQIN